MTIPAHIVQQCYKMDKDDPANPMREVEGKYYWWDETWTVLHGPFETREEANAALSEYARQL